MAGGLEAFFGGVAGKEKNPLITIVYWHVRQCTFDNVENSVSETSEITK